MTLDGQRLALVGCGSMAEAMIRGLLRDRLLEAASMTGSHPRAERREELAGRYGVRMVAANVDAVRAASVVLITVKPQLVDEVLDQLRGRLNPDVLVLSIVAGLRMDHVAERLGVERVVRAMPNTPGQIGEGITVWAAREAVGDAGLGVVRAILSSLGTDERVAHEGELDMATALSGTGPAYAFLFMEALIDAGVHIGFSRHLATRLVFETMRGAVAYAAQAPEHLAKLRNQVTSPGGTSADAQYALEKGRLRTVLSDAVWAAYRRCQELGRQAAAGDGDGVPQP